MSVLVILSLSLSLSSMLCLYSVLVADFIGCYPESGQAAQPCNVLLGLPTIALHLLTQIAYLIVSFRS